MIDLLKDVVAFLVARRKFWLAPAILGILLVGSLLVYTQSSVLAPLLYTIF